MLLAGFVCSAGPGAWGQDASAQSLGDVARKTRKEHSSAAHLPGKQVANDDDDGPDASGVWRVRLCSLMPCYELSITLPRNPKWKRAADQPRPVLIPLSGHEQDSGRTIGVYAAESIEPMYYLDKAERTFLQGRFARPEYFGQAARIVLDEHVQIDGSAATITHFTITTAELKYRGLSVVATSPNGNYGFACVFRDEDSVVGISVCDAIVKSARNQALLPLKPPVYSQPDDPPDDPPAQPEENDLE
jgi:hypothetical protein